MCVQSLSHIWLSVIPRTRKNPDAGKDWGQEEKGTTEDEMVGWHHQLDGCEFEQALEVGDGQGSLVCCSPWGHKELNTTEWLNWSELMLKLKFHYFGLLIRRTDSFEKTLTLGKIESGRRRGWQDEMVGWHHWLYGHESEQALGVGNGQGSLVCCSPWHPRVGYDWMTELSWTNSSHVFKMN